MAHSKAIAAIHTSAVSQVWVEPASGYGFIDAAIERAHSSIDLSMYELSDPTIEQDLVARAKAGVDVRVILNSAYDGASENASAAKVYGFTINSTPASSRPWWTMAFRA